MIRKYLFLWLAMKVVFLPLLAISEESKNKDFKIEGNWQTECFEGVKGRGVYIRIVQAIQGNEIQQAIRFYMDEKCTEPMVTISQKLAFTLGKEGASDVKTKEIDELLQSSVLIPESDLYMNISNSVKICGLTEWKKGEGKEVTGLDCSPYGPKFEPKDQKFFGMVHVEPKSLIYSAMTPVLTDRPKEISTKHQDIFYQNRADADAAVQQKSDAENAMQEKENVKLTAKIVDNNDYDGSLTLPGGKFKVRAAAFFESGRAGILLTSEVDGKEYDVVWGTWAAFHLVDGDQSKDILLARFTPPCVLNTTYVWVGEVTGKHDIEIKGVVLSEKDFKALSGSLDLNALQSKKIGEFFLDD